MLPRVGKFQGSRLPQKNSRPEVIGINYPSSPHRTGRRGWKEKWLNLFTGKWACNDFASAQRGTKSVWKIIVTILCQQGYAYWNKKEKERMTSVKQKRTAALIAGVNSTISSKASLHHPTGGDNGPFRHVYRLRQRVCTSEFWATAGTGRFPCLAGSRAGGFGINLYNLLDFSRKLFVTMVTVAAGLDHAVGRKVHGYGRQRLRGARLGKAPC